MVIVTVQRWLKKVWSWEKKQFTVCYSKRFRYLFVNECFLQLISKKAASEIIIRQALSDLERWDLTCKFILSSHNDSKSQNIMLIKEFTDILNEVIWANDCKLSFTKFINILCFVSDRRPSKFVAIYEKFYWLPKFFWTC